MEMYRRRWPLLAIAMCMLLVSSCRSVRYLPSETVHDTARIVIRTADTLKLKDSVFVERMVKGDTVYVTKDRWHTRDNISVRKDTMYISRTDTVRVPIKEKANATWYERNVKPMVESFSALIMLSVFGIVVWIIGKFIYRIHIGNYEKNS